MSLRGSCHGDVSFGAKIEFPPANKKNPTLGNFLPQKKSEEQRKNVVLLVGLGRLSKILKDGYKHIFFFWGGGQCTRFLGVMN